MSKKDDNYDPEVSKRQTAANVSGGIVAAFLRNEPSMTVSDVCTAFPEIADTVYNWINQKPADTFRGDGVESDSGSGSQEAIDF